MTGMCFFTVAFS